MATSIKNDKSKENFQIKNISIKTIGLVLLIIIAVILIINGNPMNLMESSTSQEVESESSNDANIRSLEERLTGILSGIDGVGELKVMITLDSGKEIVPILEKQATGINYGTEQDDMDISVKPVIVSNTTGGEPIVLKELEPAIRGVIVVAQGADDIGIRYNLEVAVMTVLGIDEDRVEIFNMK